LIAYRNYLKHDKHRQSLLDILDEIKAKGYAFPEPSYKRIPKEFEQTISHSALTRFNAMYAYKQIPLQKEILCSEQLVDYAFNIYEDLLPLQQWIYEMTLTIEV